MKKNIKKFDKPMSPEQEKKLDSIIDNSDYARGYRACEAKHRRSIADMKVHLGSVPDEITQAVINWFVNYSPDWGLVLKNNTWQYHLANHFYNLGVAHEREAIMKLREEVMKKYDIEAIKQMQIEHPLDIDECFRLND